MCARHHLRLSLSLEKAPAARRAAPLCVLHVDAITGATLSKDTDARGDEGAIR